MNPSTLAFFALRRGKSNCGFHDQVNHLGACFLLNSLISVD